MTNARVSGGLRPTALTFAIGALLFAGRPAAAAPQASAGQPADIAPSAYLYRADRKTEENPPEAWLLLMQQANLPFEQPMDLSAPAVKQALCGLLWEEVRPLHELELSWPAESARQPPADDLVVTCFDATDDTAHTWWNPRGLKTAGPPRVSPDGRTYTYTIPTETWGVVVSVRGQIGAAGLAVPSMRALVPQRWKELAVEVEWGYEPARAGLSYDGRLEPYDGRVAGLHPLAGDTGTALAGPDAWRSSPGTGPRRGVAFRLLYIGDSRWRQVWPYHAQAEDAPRTIVTVRTSFGNFSFLAADLEQGPILAPEYGFFVRAAGPSGFGNPDSPPGAQAPADSHPPFDQSSHAASAAEFLRELAAKGRATIRQQTRLHAEQTWEGAVTAMRGTNLPAYPVPPYGPAMQVDLPCRQLTDQWNLGAWHLLRHSAKDPQGHWRFNDFPFGILASETYMILRALDLQGMHQQAADGLDQWLTLPMQPHAVAGTHPWSKPDRPLGHFSDGNGCLTHAVGLEGAGGHMDAVHCMGPGAIMFTLAEHFRLTGDLDWLKANAPRMKANAEWILRQRRLLAQNLPGGERLWSHGLQPAQVVTPDSARMHQQFYETEAYYWLAVKSMAELLGKLDPAEGARLAAEAEAYRKDLLAAVDRSITLTPVTAVRDGTYHSFIPFAPYVRGFASGAWGWRRCQGHVGAIYWDTVQSADPLLSPAGLLSPEDPRVQGHLDVLEDRLLLENEKVAARTPGFNAARDWFSRASWQYQCGLERHANVHLLAGDAPNFIRSLLNQYAVDIVPGEYTFREHTTAGPPDKLYEESCFLERFRMMLVMEQGDTLWLARATPRAWLEQGNRIAVKNAPTHFGTLAYEILSDVDHGRITVSLQPPARTPPAHLLLQLRHPTAAPISKVLLNGAEWSDFDPTAGWVRLPGATGTARLEVLYAPTEALRPQVKVVEGGESKTRPEDCRATLVGPSVNPPDPFPGFGGFVGWDSPIRLSNGQWLVGFNAGYWHASAPTPLRYPAKTLEQYYKLGLPAGIIAPTGGRALLIRSSDEGKTWTKPTLLIDTPADDRHPAFVELRDGTILCSFFTYAGEPEDGDLRKAPELATRVHIIRSFDGGRTWEQKPRTVRTPFLCEETDGPFARLKDGSVLIAINGRPQSGPPDQAAVLRATHHGKHWKLLSTVRAAHDLQEITVAELPDLRLVLMARPEGDICWSPDHGRTWTPPVTFGMRMYAPSLYVLRDGTLVCLHGAYAPGHGGLRLIFSTDGGRTWIAPAKDHGFLVDHAYGYGKAIELPDGSLFITYLATGGHRTEDARNNSIRCIRLRVRPDHSGIDLLPAPNR